MPGNFSGPNKSNARTPKIAISGTENISWRLIRQGRPPAPYNVLGPP